MDSSSSAPSSRRQNAGMEAEPAPYGARPDAVDGDMDRDTKKRIQNRIAQRTYRNRMKQRLEDLQQQLRDVQQKQQLQNQPQQGASQRAEPGSEWVASNAVTSGPSHGKRDRAGHNIPIGVAPNGLAHETWGNTPRPARDSAVRDGFQWHDASQWQRSFLHDSMYMPGLTPPSSTTGGPPSAALLSPDLGVTDTGLSMPRFNTDAGWEGLTSTAPPGGFMTGEGVDDESDQGAFTSGTPPNGDSDPFRRSPWRDGLPAMACTNSHTATTASTALTPQTGSNTNTTPGTEDLSDRHSPAAPGSRRDRGSTAPGRGAASEDRLDHLLRAVRAADIDSFDALAAQWYVDPLPTRSPLALEQRMSRHRGLPALLSELRQHANEWSAWERQGYQIETLRAAEDICARELIELGACLEVGQEREAELQEQLPNLCAFLSELASRNPRLRQTDRSRVVFMCLKLLCGL